MIKQKKPILTIRKKRKGKDRMIKLYFHFINFFHIFFIANREECTLNLYTNVRFVK